MKHLSINNFEHFTEHIKTPTKKGPKWINSKGQGPSRKIQRIGFNRRSSSRRGGHWYNRPFPYIHNRQPVIYNRQPVVVDRRPVIVNTSTKSNHNLLYIIIIGLIIFSILLFLILLRKK